MATSNVSGKADVSGSVFGLCASFEQESYVPDALSALASHDQRRAEHVEAHVNDGGISSEGRAFEDGDWSLCLLLL